MLLTLFCVLATLTIHPVIASGVFLPLAVASIIWVNPGVHAAPWNPFAGEAEKDAFLSFDVGAADRFLKGGAEPGTFFRFQEGIFALMWNRDGGALAVGDAVKLKTPVTATITGSTAAVITASGATFSVPSDVNPGLVGKFVFVKTGTGVGNLRRILDNTGTTLTVARYYPSLQQAAVNTADALNPIPVNTDTCSVVSFDEVIGTASANDLVFGVSRGTAANNDLAIIQVAGPVLATVVGSTDATTAMGPVVASGVAKQLKGPTTAGETAADARTCCGYSFDLWGGAASLRHIYLTGNNVIGTCAPKIR